MADVTRTTRFRFWLWLIALVGVIVPRRLRADWRQEWEAELHYREALLKNWERLDWRSKLDLLWRSTSAFWDALWLQPRRWEDEMIQDLRYGVRMLAKHPSFTCVAVLTLALGIGANTAIFSVVNAVLLRALPYEESERLMSIESIDLKTQRKLSESYPDFQDWKEQGSVFEQMAILRSANDDTTLAGTDKSEVVQGARVSADFFSVLRVRAAIGRTFQPEEDYPHQVRVVVLSHGLWQRRFGSNPNVIGQAVTLDGNPYTVIGVLPATFRFPLSPTEVELWKPLSADGAVALADRNLRYIQAIGRLKRGVALKQAQAEMSAIAHRLEEQYPNSNKNVGILLSPLQEQLGNNVRLALLVLFGAVGLVLLIACANVANLMLARAAARQKEIAIRAALGASRRRVIRQLLTESLLLALVGSSLGLLLTKWGIKLLMTLSPGDLPRPEEITIDAQVLIFTISLTLLTGILFGLAPALQSSKLDLNATLKAGGRSSGASAGHHHLRHLLVITELALALVLLIGAGLLLKSFSHLQRVTLGFKPENLLTMRVRYPDFWYSPNSKKTAYFQQVLERVATLPGVQAAGYANGLPPAGGFGISVMIEGRPITAPSDLPTARYQAVSAEYFRAMGIPLQQGRELTEQDGQTDRAVVVINEVMARAFWPHENPIGRRISLRGSTLKNYVSGEPAWREVIGVVGDVKNDGLMAESKPGFFIPYLQSPQFSYDLVVRTVAPPMTLANAVQNAILSVDQEHPALRVQTMEQMLVQAMARQRFSMLLLSTFAVIALALAAIGIYGVMSYSVSQRTHEIGIRLALGALNTDVVRLFIKQGMALVWLGVALGLGGAFALTRVMRSLLFGVSANDPLTFAGVALLLSLVALLACYLPAQRATKVDPLVALRQE